MLVVDQKPLASAMPSPVRRPGNRQAYKSGMTLAEAGRLARVATTSPSWPATRTCWAPVPRSPTRCRRPWLQPEIYPDPYCETLRDAMGSRLSVDPARIVMSPGSEALIDYLFRAVIASRVTRS
jgi:histidinol-phosphate aminotransferase